MSHKLRTPHLPDPTLCLSGGELHDTAMECMLELVATAPRHTIQGLLLDSSWVKVGKTAVILDVQWGDCVCVCVCPCVRACVHVCRQHVYTFTL